MSSSSIPTAADEDGDARITAIHPDIFQSHILNRLDGRTLAVASCASVQFLSLCNDDAIWKDICYSTWPSTADRRVAASISAFSSGHRSFYSDASPSLRHYPPRRSHQPRAPAASELISAVDIFYEDKLIHSNVLVTDAQSSSFLIDDIFMLEISDLEELEAVPLNLDDGACYERAEEHLRLSWILIDPVKRRAINLSSQKAVEARRHCLTDDVQLRYASVFPVSGGDRSVMCVVFVHCAWKEDGGLRVIEAYMNMKASDGTSLTAIEGLRTLGEAIEEKRWRSNFKREKDVYENFCNVKTQQREINHVRGEGDRNMACVVTGICVFFTSCSIYFHGHEFMDYIITMVLSNLAS